MLRAIIILVGLVVGYASCAALLGVDPIEAIGSDTPADLGEQQLRRAASPESAAAAVALYKIAMLRNPAAPRRWTQLGDAFLAAGDTQRAADCFARARELGNGIPEVLKRVAEFDFAQGRTNAGMDAGAQLLSLDPSFEKPVFEMYGRQSLPVVQILETGLRGQPAALSYFEHLRKTATAGDVEQAWQWLAARSLFASSRWVSPRLAQDYVETQLKAGNFDQAALASASFLRPIDPRFLHPSLVFDGGFEVEPNGSPLEWTIFPFAGIVVERDHRAAHSGAASLHIDFTNAGNALFGHVLQRLYPHPGRWRARAFIRTLDLSSSQGIRLLISDSTSPERLYVQTPAVAGTHDWTEVETVFTVTPATTELRLQIFRPKDASQDGVIRGNAWIDDISLEPE